MSALHLPNLNQVSIRDPLWSRYVEMVADVIIPYQWDILNDRVPGAEKSHCLDNFRIAAGEREGEHQGVVFLDSDVYKWLESVAYCIHNGSGRRFEAIADEVIGLIARAQDEDGYLNTYFTIAEPGARWTNLVEGHELYCAGYLIEAAVAYYEATGKDSLLRIGRRFADLICTVFGRGEGQLRGYPGHQEIELAFVRLYRCTGEERYLACARYFIEERGSQPNYFEAEIRKRNGRTIFPEFEHYDCRYSQSHIPVREQKTAEGHAVRALYMYCAMADLAQECGDRELLEGCRALWGNVTQRRMYITGGVGSSAVFERFTTDFDLPNDSAYSETCASIGLALFGRRMALIEQDARYYDIVERALCNTILAGISLQGDRYFYVNPLEVYPPNCMDHTSMQHVKAERQRWFSVACCPPNVARTLASLAHYLYAQQERTIYVNMFVSSTFEARCGDDAATCTLDADLMRGGAVTIRVRTHGGAPFSLAVRVPEYAGDLLFLLDGRQIAPRVEKGYAEITCEDDDYTVTLQMRLKPRWVMAHPAVRQDAGKIALMKGPFIYCLEEMDNGSNLASVYVAPDAPVGECVNMALPDALPMLTYEGRKLVARGWEDGELYGSADWQFEPVALKAIPYCVWGNRRPGEMLVWQKAIL